jgi:hypothetical protein
MVQRFGVVIYLPPLSWNICVTGQNNLLSLHPLNTEPSIGASHQISVHFDKAVSEKKILKTRIA